MNSNNGSSEKDNEGAVGGEAPNRPRNDSESSKSSEEGTDQGKRQKTGQELMFQGVAASPPKFISLEEIISASTAMKDMVLAHEIAVDQDFRLKKKAEPKENTLEKVVKDTLQRAFWDVLACQLKEDPPNYNHALILLAEIKENLLSLLLPQHIKLREQINDTLDIDLIRQQAEKGVLDFQHYAQYVINLMSKLCAPARDEKIRQLMQMTDTVEIFKGILETLELMILDWANFHIRLIRPTVINNSVEYEKQKFKKYLEVTPDGLERTRHWLLKHYTKEQTGSIQTITSQVVANAYLELMEWDPKNEYPETLEMDEARFMDLGERYLKLSVCGAVVLVTGTTVPSLQGVASFKKTLKTNITTILQEASNPEAIERLMPSIAIQVLKDVNDAVVECGLNPLNDSTTKILQGQIIDIGKPDHSIKQLVQRRIKEFLLSTITSPTAAPIRIPPGLTSLDSELTGLTGQFLRLVSHNRAVFGEFYTNIVAAVIDRPLP